METLGFSADGFFGPEFTLELSDPFVLLVFFVCVGLFHFWFDFDFDFFDFFDLDFLFLWFFH